MTTDQHNLTSNVATALVANGPRRTNCMKSRLLQELSASAEQGPFMRQFLVVVNPASGGSGHSPIRSYGHRKRNTGLAVGPVQVGPARAGEGGPESLLR